MTGYNDYTQGTNTLHISDNISQYEAARSSFFVFQIAPDQLTNLRHPDFDTSSGEAGDADKYDGQTASDYIRLNVTKASVPNFSVETGEYRRGNDVVHYATTPTFADGSITVDELDDTLRALGLNPLKKDLVDIKKKFEAEGGKIKFNQFVEIYLIFQKKAPTKQSLIDCFKIFNQDENGCISLDDFKQSMTTMGDKFDDNQFDDIIKYANVEGDKLNCVKFIEDLINKSNM